MSEAAKNITEENFPVFKKLVEEVLVKVTDKPLLNNPIICERRSTTGKVEKYIPEAQALEIVIKITNHKAEIDNRGRRIKDLIDAALNDMAVNARVNTLDLMANYVLRKDEKPESQVEQSFKWKDYIHKNKDLLLQSDSNNVSVQEKLDTDLETFIKETEQFEDRVATRKSEDNKPEIVQTLNNPAHYKISQDNTNDSSKEINAKKFTHAGIRGGVYSGIMASILIALVRYINGRNISPVSTGYENIDFDRFMRYIFTPLLLFQMLAGALLGWLCCRAVLSKGRRISNLWLFVSFFFVIVVLRQAMSRDAWHIPGTYQTWDNHGNLRMGGGLLGEPDFETLATGLMGAFVILFLVQAFRKNKLAVFTKTGTLGLTFKMIIYGLLAWGLIFGIYTLLADRLGLIHKGDYLVARYFFTIDFPHPERPIFAIAMYMVYVFCFIISIKYYFSLLSD